MLNMLKRNKKGDLTINVIIVAVIALVVLVVLISIFAGKMGIFGDKTDSITDRSCKADGGSIVVSTQACDAGYHEVLTAYKDVDMASKCCMPDQ